MSSPEHCPHPLALNLHDPDVVRYYNVALTVLMATQHVEDRQTEKFQKFLSDKLGPVDGNTVFMAASNDVAEIYAQ